MMTDYQPVVRSNCETLRGTALVGTHSAVIGWNLVDPALREGLLGFAIKRTDLDPETGEILRLDWLRGYKRFAETDDGKVDQVRSLEAPFQRFRWNDYTLNAERAYIYEVYPMRGTPTALTRDEAPLAFNVRPSWEDPGDLGIFVNRGVTAAMAYLARFENNHPEDVGDAAFEWLSRGLKESLIGLIKGTNPGDALHVTIYEFHDDDVAAELKSSLDRGVEVHIVHDAKPGKHSTEKSEEVINRHGLQDNRTKRTSVAISHNKIVVHLVDGAPRQMWTGSANFSMNAFNFQTNSALIIRDLDTINHYEQYFQALLGNPPKAQSRAANQTIMEHANALDPRFAEKTFFSPIKEKDILAAAAELIRGAQSAVLISAPFGVDITMLEAMAANSDDIIEYGLVNSTVKKEIQKLHRKNTRFFTPTRLVSYLGRQWDAKAFGAHKIHAKTIVIDPWSENPKVLIGSANFSKASCSDNDENALLITGNHRLSSIIGTEFMRMYDHYKSRYYIDQLYEANKKIKKENKLLKAQGLEEKKLIEMDKHLKSDISWSRTAFNPDSPSHKFRDRIVFSGD